MTSPARRQVSRSRSRVATFFRNAALGLAPVAIAASFYAPVRGAGLAAMSLACLAAFAAWPKVVACLCSACEARCSAEDTKCPACGRRFE